MRPKYVPLSQIIRPARPIRAGRREYPILSMTMHGGLVDQATKFKKRIASADTASYKVVQRDQLVVGFPIDEGVLSFQRHHEAAIVSPAYDVWDICDRQVVHPLYLERFLRSPMALAYYRAKLRGTTARRRSIPDELFLRLDVPLPPLSEQRRIAAILDKADELRAKRREALAKLDTLSQSIFLEMFGDPRTNPRGWRLARLGDLGDIGTGSTPSRSEPDNFGGTVPWVKTTEVAWEEITSTQERLTFRGLRSSRCRVYPKGAVVVALYGQGKTRGQAAILGIDAATNQACGVLVPGPQVQAEYLLQHLMHSYEALRALGRGGNQENLNLGLLADFRVMLPPMHAQLKFGAHLRRLNVFRTSAGNAREGLAALFASLQQRAFAGSL